MARPWRYAAACVLVALWAGGCAHRAPVRSPRVPIEFHRKITFYDHALELRLARPTQLQPDTPLLLYATGDGGWRGQGGETYRRMIRWGYPVVGFSAPSYLKHLGFESGTTTPGRLARDYQRLIEYAKQTLSLPARTRTILVGVSRGAGLAVVAAERPELNAELAGVLAVSLTREEEYVRQYVVHRGTSPADMPNREIVEFKTYAYLERLRKLPLVVIQSTGDKYLPADAARTLFGPDTEQRKFFAVTSRDHGFSDARDVVFERMASSLAWMSRTRPASTPSSSLSPPPPPQVRP
jgi:pimeloyl-ACP methyl ester carboxylesterase